MSRFKKHFRVAIRAISPEQLLKFAREISGRFNSKKFGKNRRGTVMCLGIDVAILSSMKEVDVDVHFESGKSLFNDFYDRDGRHYRFKAYDVIDFSTAMRKLRKASVRS